MELAKEVTDLYPDIVAAGGLSNALAQAFVELKSPLQPAPLVNFISHARTEGGSRACQMFIAAKERLFLFDFWSKGVSYGRGSTSSLHDAAQAIHFWITEQPSLADMQHRFSFFIADEKGVAHEAGYAVEFQWETLRNHWARSVGGNPDAMSPLPLIEAAMQQPELRQLFPFTSHYMLHFSRTTGYPFTNDCPYAVPTENGRFRVYLTSRGASAEDMGEMLGEGDANEAVAILVANLPPDCGPAVDGTADDLNESHSYPSIESILKDRG